MDCLSCSYERTGCTGLRVKADGTTEQVHEPGEHPIKPAVIEALCVTWDGWAELCQECYDGEMLYCPDDVLSTRPLAESRTSHNLYTEPSAADPST
jgi:hypothetical protein